MHRSDSNRNNAFIHLSHMHNYSAPSVLTTAMHKSHSLTPFDIINKNQLSSEMWEKEMIFTHTTAYTYSFCSLFQSSSLIRSLFVVIVCLVCVMFDFRFDINVLLRIRENYLALQDCVNSILFVWFAAWRRE